LSRDEGRLVTLGSVPAAHWDAIAARGFDYVFLMGVWRRSGIGRQIARTHSGLVAEYDRVLPGWTEEDVPGSPYCIEAYEPDARMGGWAALDAARAELQARGVGLVLDFVPNHTGFDHAWVAAHPDRYVIGTEDDYRAAPGHFRVVETVGGAVYIACGRDPHFAPWTDVAQLNYCNDETREAMQDALRTIAEHCDGVRCDMAMLMLTEVFEGTWRRVLRDTWPRPATEFWPAATSAVPGLMYLAEVYWALEGTLIDQGFDYAYDKRLLDALHSPRPAPAIRALLAAASPPPAQLARFIENHDEPRSAGTLHERLPAAAALVSTMPGMRFFYEGQFEGRCIKAPVQLGRWPDEPVDECLRAYYQRALHFGTSDVVRKGEWRLLAVSAAGDETFEDIVAYRWRLGDNLAVVAVNIGRAPAQAHIALGGDLGKGSAFDFEDRLTDACYHRTRADLERTGLYVRLEAGQGHLFRVTDSSE
jgi:hypothetical protein